MRLLPDRRMRALLTAVVAAGALVLPMAPASALATATIHGHVSGAGGAPLAGVYVFFLKDAGTDSQTQYGPARTDAGGDYLFALDPGSYTVGFHDDSGVYLEQYWQHAQRFADATPVSVSTTSPGGSIDAQLELAGSISGTVTLPAGADLNSDDSDVDVVDPSTGEPVGWTWLDPAHETATGSNAYTYTVGGLPAGDYRVEFAHEDFRATVEGQFYAGHPESEGRGSADLVTVTGGADRSGVDATLRTGGTISGTLVDGTGAPVPDCEVVAFNNVDHFVARFGTTAADGSFVVGGLTSGRYGLRVGDPYGRGNGCPTTEFYTRPDGDLSTSATGLIVLSTAPGQDVSLPNPLVYGTPDITNTAPPSVTGGTPVVGTPVTADPGSWDPAGVDLAYQWRANGSPIAGATGASYTPVASDSGKGLSVVVTATKPGYGSAMAISANSAPVASAGPSPTIKNTVPPSVTGGPPVVGTPVSADPGSWDPADVDLAYQWRADGSPIAGATGASYTPVASDAGKRLSVVVTATKPGYGSATATSADSAPVASASPSPSITNTAPPTVSGSARVGQVLSAYAGDWSTANGAPTTTLQWLRDGAVVPGATAATYLLGPDDLGSRISLRVTATRDGYPAAQRTTAQTNPVVRGSFTLTSTPRLRGSLRVGRVVRAIPPSCNPAASSVRFQWLRNGVPIRRAAARRARYVLSRADRGKRISVRITLLRPAYAPASSVARRAGRVR